MTAFKYRVRLKAGPYTTVSNGFELDKIVREYLNEIASIEIEIESNGETCKDCGGHGRITCASEE